MGTEAALNAGLDRLEAIAKAIGDLDDLVGLINRALPRAKPWQRQLSSHLADVDRTIQILRMTVAMERSDTEILEAARTVEASCRRAELAISATRADLTTKASVRLALQLGLKLPRLLAEASARLADETAATA